MPFDMTPRIAEWQTALLDTSKRNRLVKFTAGARGGVELLHPGPQAVWDRLIKDNRGFTFPWKRTLLGVPPEEIDGDEKKEKAAPPQKDLLWKCQASPKLAADHLLTDLSDAALGKSLLRISRAANESLTDHGVATLYAAFGFLTWYETPQDDDEIRSPLALVRVNLERATVDANWTLTEEEDEVVLNYSLMEMLRTGFKVDLPRAEIDQDEVGSLGKYLDAVREAIKPQERWRVSEGVAVGNFNFQKLAMWEDLKRNAAKVAAHPLCRALAGDAAAVAAPPAHLPTAAELDAGPLDTAYILDSDGSQTEAVEAVKAGANVVIDGPPGTGKSQTIANIIAASLHAGKTVLFVAEKSAALEVVKNRLDKCGLGDFCLELHAAKANKAGVLKELGRCLDLRPEGADDTAQLLRDHAAAKARLNDYATALHASRQPLDRTAFQVHGELAKLAAQPGRSRWTHPDPLSLDAEFLRKATETLEQLGQCAAVVANPDGHPWQGCKLEAASQAAVSDAQFHSGRVAAGAAKVAATMASLGCEESTSIPGWKAAIARAAAATQGPLLPEAWFAVDPAAAASAAKDLHAASVELRSLQPTLAGFDAEKVRALTPEAVAGLKSAGGTGTVRGGVAAVRVEADAHRASAKAVEGLAAALAAVANDLRLPTPALDQAGKLAADAAEFARAKPIPMAWWDKPRRDELTTVAARGKADAEAAAAMRAKLVAIFNPAALAPENAADAAAAATESKSVWRLFGSGSAQKRIAKFAVGRAPETNTYSDLAAYHAKAEAARQAAAAYPNDVSTSADGSPDWAATLDALKRVERMAAGNPPAEWKAAAAPGGTLDRAGMATRAATLATADAAFRTVAEKLGGIRTPAEVAAYWRAAAGAADKDADTRDAVVNLFKPDFDPPAADLPRFVDALAACVARRARIVECVNLLALPEAPAAAEAKDWAATSALGDHLAAFLAKFPHPTPVVVAALTTQAGRDTLAKAIPPANAIAADGFDESWAYSTGTLFDPAATLAGGLTLNTAPAGQLAEWAAARTKDADKAAEWIRFARVKRDAVALKLEAVVAETEAGTLSPADAATAFRHRFLGLWLDALYAKDAALGRFAGDDHDRAVAKFQDLDKKAITTAPAAIRRGLLTKPNRPRSDGFAPGSSELGILLREANKKRRHLPLRKLFEQTPTILPRLKPCLMMSPLAVSTFLEATDLSFDLIIFDEASQVRPHDAVASLLRGKQLVCAGDPKQLPPTDFFSRSLTDGDEAPEDEPEVGTAGFESLLDVCLSTGYVRKRLRWHYRSRREGLIAFSNKNFYESNLVTFPSAADAAGTGVDFVHVKDGVFSNSANKVEARRTAQLVIDHAAKRPHRSLGVIAFSKSQQDAILDALEELRKDSPDTEPFFGGDQPEPFFVKNLENVQGDERDCIVLAVGYGPDGKGNVPMRFGPVNNAGGERRLNVAVTRSRFAMTVVASMTAADIDTGRAKGQGSRLLRDFLDYAANGTPALGVKNTGATAAPESAFEEAVAAALKAKGLTLHPNVGCGETRVAFGVVHPDRPGVYAAGVETDGKAYRDCPTARDRDRLRPSVLAGLGWKIVRLWSADWVRDPNGQADRVLKAASEAPPAEPVPPAPVAEKPVAAEPPAPVVEQPPPLPVEEAAAEPEAEPVKPYESIDDVPYSAIYGAILEVLAECGATAEEDLYREASKRLGFKKLGPRIRKKIAQRLQAQIDDHEVVKQDDGRLRAP